MLVQGNTQEAITTKMLPEFSILELTEDSEDFHLPVASNDSKVEHQSNQSVWHLVSGWVKVSFGLRTPGGASCSCQ